MKKTTAFAVGFATYLAGLAVGYRTLVRNRCLNWGATPEEAVGAMAGDELQARPDIVSTRAVTIHAEPAAIWPWLVQMGPGRGGAYTYDWIENLLGLDMHSAQEILPQFQNLRVDDEFTLGAGGPTMRVAVLDPEHALVFGSTDGNWVWAFELRAGADGTRLLSRNRITLPSTFPPFRLPYQLIMEPGSWVMERKMLLGIKERAERPAVTAPVDTVVQV
ncbi:SRPBCC family protein [Nocardia bovistercoris]|uniref:SRPBCC family protein n=1 Tax=Nocardia bovistercoris TaxID=2785916 RepID=A0A931IH78_9NOCA|nr:SRPBCC family protein [Nocardia bovistercoris]MBH0781722.1 SRPBCC family protein [Nocardia bovistercoris]